MQILSIAQEAAAIVGTEPPKTLFNKNNPQSILFLSLVNDALEALKRYGDWQQTEKEASFYITNTATYHIPDLVDDFFALIPDTIYIKDRQEKVIGSISPAQFMREKVFQTADGRVKFHIKGNTFCFVKRPPIGSKVVFQYRTSAVVKESEKTNGVYRYKQMPTKDTDMPLFDWYLIKLALIWRWFKRNALPYDEAYKEYQDEVKKAFMTSRSMENISLIGGGITQATGGVYVQFKNDN